MTVRTPILQHALDSMDDRPDIRLQDRQEDTTVRNASAQNQNDISAKMKTTANLAVATSLPQETRETLKLASDLTKNRVRLVLAIDRLTLAIDKLALTLDRLALALDRLTTSMPR